MAPIKPHFNTVFWSQKQTETLLPDFQTGFNILHQKLVQSGIENEELISFFKDRIAVEELYATKLTEQGSTKNNNTGFERDEGAGLKKCFTKLKETSTNFGQHHQATATTLTTQVLKPLQEFHEKYRQNITNSMQNMEVFLKQFDSLLKEAEISKNIYHKKCKEADRAEELALKNETVAASSNQVPKTATGKYEGAENNDTTTLAVTESVKDSYSIQLGSTTLSQSKFDSLTRKMKAEIPTRELRLSVLGRFQNISSGEEIAKWLQHNLPQCKDSPAMSDVIGQQLVQDYNILRFIGRGSRFIASSRAFYQWRITEEGTVIIADSNSKGSYTLGGFTEKMTIPSFSVNSVTSESSLEQHKKARCEAEKADEIYRTYIKRLDRMRMIIEEAMFSHLTKMEQVELQRINQIKQLISSFIVSLSSSIPKDKIEIEEMMVYQESLKPDQDIQYLVQQYAVSGFNSKAIIYNNYYHGYAHDQVFGISLEELSRQRNDNVPRFVSLSLDAIQEGTNKVDEESRFRLWSTLCPLEHIHATCVEFNISSDRLNAEMFQEKDPVILIGVLRYFLLELPECLMTYEFYDLFETLFVGGEDKDNQILLPTLSKLIATLPDSHFFTLKAILDIITSYVKKYSIPQDTIEFICQYMGPIILRPLTESYTTITSRLPIKFFKHLIMFYNEIFSETTLKLHAESEKRRHAKPLIVTENDIHTLSESNSNASSVKGTENKTHKNTKRSSSLMSFMRPSVIGIFQKSSTTQNLKTPSIPPSRSVSFSFGSPITRSDSPPLSPKKIHEGPANLSSGPEIMFDIDDTMFLNGSILENHNDSILKDMDLENNNSLNGAKSLFKNKRDNDTQIMSHKLKEVIDSSFFDDDDDD